MKMFLKTFVLIASASLYYADQARADISDTSIDITGIYLGAPADYEDAETGGASGIIGVRYFTLNYQRSFNYFATIALSSDTFTAAEDRDNAQEVTSIDEGVQFIDSVFTGFIVSGGFTYNTNTLDNVIFYAGPEVMFGDTIVTLEEDNFLSIPDRRFGLLGGVMIGFEAFFVGVDFSTNTNSLRLALGYGF